MCKEKFVAQLSEKVLRFKNPAGTSRGVYTTRKVCFLSLNTVGDPHAIGVGECAPLPNLSCDYSPDYMNVLKSAAREFCQTGEIDYEGLRPYPSVLFAFETALSSLQWVKKLRLKDREQRTECRGRSNSCMKPLLSTLFDTPFGRGEEGIPINGLVWMGSFEEMYCRIEEKLAQGFHCVKLKIGAIDWQKEVELIRFVRQHFNQEQIELRVDANGAFAPTEALHKLEQLAQYGIHSIEQPIRQRQWQQMAILCRQSSIPIALDEELIGINDLEEKKALLDTIHPHYIILKPSLHGGIHGCLEWINLARQRGIGSWITSALESNVGLNAIAHFAAWVYGPHITMPQGLGTGQLFTDNIPMPLEIRGDQLWRVCQ